MRECVRFPRGYRNSGVSVPLARNVRIAGMLLFQPFARVRRVAAMTAALPVLLSAEAEALRIMPLGDSITRGSHRAGAVPGGYRTELANRLGAAGVVFDYVGNRDDNPAPGVDPDHQGSDGIRTDETLAIISNWLPRDPDIVLMKLGTNDLIQGRTIQAAIGDLGTLIDQITNDDPQRKLFVATILPIVEARNGRTIADWETVINSYNDAVRSLVSTKASQGKNVYLTEMHGSIDPNAAFLSTDGTHPGPSGYDQMGAVWFQSVQPHVGGGTPDPPDASNDSYQVYAGQTIDVPAPGVLANDTAPSGLPLQANLINGPANGLLTLNPNGSFQYDPQGSGPGQTSFTYQATDGSQTSDPATVTLNILAPGTNGLENGGFESALDSWAASGNVAVKSAAPYSAFEGNSLVAFHSGNTAPGGILTQTFATEPGDTVELEFAIGVLAYNTMVQTLEVTISGGGGSVQETFTIQGVGGGTVVWRSESLAWTAAGTSTSVTFRDLSADGTAIDLLLDGVSVTITPASNPGQAGVVSMTTAGEPGTMSIEVLTSGPGRYFLEWSGDCSVWTRGESFETSSAGNLTFAEPSPPEVPAADRRFFRIGWEEIP